MTETTEIQDDTSDRKALWDKVNYMQHQIKDLKEHDSQCDERHTFWQERDVQHQAYQEKNNEALRQLTLSNLELAKTLTEVNKTVKEILPTIQRASTDYTIRDWLRKEGIPYIVLLLGLFLTVKHLFIE